MTGTRERDLQDYVIARLMGHVRNTLSGTRHETRLAALCVLRSRAPRIV